MSEGRTMSNRKPWWRRVGCILPPVLIILLLVGGAWIYLSVYQGRDISRVTGVPVKIALPDCVKSPDQIKSISFHTQSAGETIKDVTYVCDGRIYSHEYNDFGILQGTIEWTYK